MSGQPPAPTIGVTVSARAVGTKATGRAARNAAELRAALTRQGAHVCLLPPGADLSATALDGLLLGGGGDLDPALGIYASTCVPDLLSDVDRERDDFELSLCRSAVANGLPLLGICRGAQTIGAALGCLLVSDIPSERSGSVVHRRAGEHVWHTVELDATSRLSQLLGEARFEVNSSHHQAVDSLGEGVRRVAWAEDGVTEAIEWGEGFVVGVQWHPERMGNSPPSERLFRALVDAATMYQQTRGHRQ